ncbi:unnamed protein product [Phytomonas sp. Hart1]|nr:unnamed protein product [Phytomonas sp. Hart1]|eukprot:CCW69229.1 unnamed protein product [Phytomonas sp. isolate Hart1]
MRRVFIEIKLCVKKTRYIASPILSLFMEVFMVIYLVFKQCEWKNGWLYSNSESLQENYVRYGIRYELFIIYLFNYLFFFQRREERNSTSNYHAIL